MAGHQNIQWQMKETTCPPLLVQEEMPPLLQWQQKEVELGLKM
jgi:hypothetical protein